MKENWTYKKLGEVCEIYQPQTISTEMLVPDGEYLVYGANGIIGRYDKYNHIESEVLLTCRGATCGSINVSVPYSWINGNAMVIHPIDDSVFCSRSFLVYLMKSIDYSLVITGAAQPQITRQKLSPVKIAIPPIETQSRIVAELDLLQSIIDKQKAQLKELDNLAQAVFYDMFGDPVENEKGWEVKRVEDLCEVSSAKRVLVEDVVESGIPFLRGTELTALSKVVSSKDVKFTMFITPEHYERVKSITGVPKKGDILIPSINSEGITWVVDTDEPFYFKDGRVIWVHVNTDAFVSQYLSFVISKILKANYTVLTSGATFLELKLFIIRDLVVPIPPLSLQQSFAAKIESIEKQKATITKSIEESQKLFDCTMDKYFG
jgi:type I restriction enzyme S subunit